MVQRKISGVPGVRFGVPLLCSVRLGVPSRCENKTFIVIIAISLDQLLKRYVFETRGQNRHRLIPPRALFEQNLFQYLMAYRTTVFLLIHTLPNLPSYTT